MLLSLLLLLLLLLLTDNTTTTTALPPADWVNGIQHHDLLYSEDETTQHQEPVLSNGVVGWQVDSPFFFVSGLYTKRDGGVRRARIPSQLSILPHAMDAAASTLFLGEALDLRTGSFIRRRRFTTSASTYDVEQRWYVHRALHSVLAMEIKVTTTSTRPFELQLIDTSATKKNDPDVIFRDLSAQNPGLRVWRGKVQDPDSVKNSTTNQAPDVIVALVSTHIPAFLSITGNQTWHFITAVRTSIGDPTGKYGHDPIQGTLVDHKMAQMMAPSQELFNLHRDTWKDGWNTARIEVASTDPWLPMAVNSSVYALYSAARADWPFGLGRGGLTEDFGGHIFWDAEVFLFPSLLLMDPTWARGLLEYRFDRLTAVMERAQTLGFSGGGGGGAAAFPWESATTGEEVTPEDGVYADGKGAHVSGAVSWAVWQYWLATNDKGWLDKVGFPLLRAVAEFWVARAEVVGDSNRTAAHIRGVIPPDEGAGVVNDSVYTNALARQSLTYAVRAAKVILAASCSSAAAAHHQEEEEEVEVEVSQAAGLITSGMVMARYTPEDLQASVAAWETLASQLVVPFDATRGIHLEYEGYTNQSIQQADAVLLGYPLGYFNNNDGAQQNIRKQDLLYYSDKALADDAGGMGALTWGLYTVNALDVGVHDEARASFLRTYQSYCQPPFGIWTEKKDNDTHFLPAAGGFLQALVHGYGGFRLLQDEEEEEEATSMLRLSPQCPEGVWYLKYRHLTFFGNHFGLNYTCSSSSVAGKDEDSMSLFLFRIEPNAPFLSLVLGDGGGSRAQQRLPLIAGEVLTVPRQEAFLKVRRGKEVGRGG